MAANRIVARLLDGRTIKGSTSDFVPARDMFHIHTLTGDTVPVKLADLKAVFFVRDHDGDPRHRESNRFEEGEIVRGRKILVTFRDGETLVGSTQGYTPDRPGFFIIPADPQSNIERCYVVTSSTRDVQVL